MTTCGCKTPDSWTTNAVMCATCPHRPMPGECKQACQLDGESIVLRVMGAKTCPIGRHLDADGTLEWAGLRWNGVPYPLHLALRVGWVRRLWGFGLRRPLPECGCYAPLKDWWENSRLRRMIGTFRGVQHGRVQR